MYREPTAPPSHEAPPAELVYEMVMRQTGATAARGLLGVMTVGTAAGIAVGALTGPTGGLVAGLFSGTVVVLWQRRAPGGDGVLLHVDGGLLELRDRRSGKTTERIRLADLADVALDTKSENSIQEGSSAIPAIAFQEGRIGPTIDKARIVLVRTDPDRTIPLSEERGSYSEASEQLGKVRVFLRKHRWLPADERDAPTSTD